MINSKEIRIPINNMLNANDYFNTGIITAQAPFGELVIYIPDLTRVLEDEMSNHNYRMGVMGVINGTSLCIVGNNIIAKISNMKNGVPDSFYYDDSNSLRYRGYGVILSGSSQGITFLPSRPNIYSHKRSDISDRERLSQAHLEAVSKLIAQVGFAQKGEYRDGWMACLRQICLNLGIDVPSMVPFEGMDKVLSNQSIIEQIQAEADHVIRYK